MITQKPISFKIDIDYLKDIDRLIHTYSWYTTRNKELNHAVRMYIEMKRAIALCNEEGNPSGIRDFITRYFKKETGKLF